MRVLNLVTNPDAPFFRQQVSSLAERGVSSDVLAPQGEHTPDDSRSLADYARLAGETVRTSFGEYDLVHANYGLTAPAAVAQPNLPVVLTLWGSDLLGPWSLRTMSTWCARRCDEVIVMSEAMAKRVPGDCHVIPHGVDFETFRPQDRGEARAAVGWPEDRRHVLFPYDPGRTVKNHPLARRVVEAAAERVDAPVELQAVSGVPHERIPTYFNAADCLLLTSESEGSPNVVKEALACNVPVVARDVGDVEERLAGVSPAGVGRDREELVAALVSVLRADERPGSRSAMDHLRRERVARRIDRVYERALDGESSANRTPETPADSPARAEASGP